MRGERWCCCDLFPSLCRGNLGNEWALIDMLLIDPIQAKLRMQSILGVGCLEMTKIRRRDTFRWAQVPAKDMFVLYFISQGNVVGISALDQGNTSCFLGLLFSVRVYEPLTPFMLYDTRIEVLKYYFSLPSPTLGVGRVRIYGYTGPSPYRLAFMPSQKCVESYRMITNEINCLI